ncbi:protein of unknown function [Cyanobium sp. NIES-981]|nr:protein of unknown function [Cyanobium sp. NIES-981]
MQPSLWALGARREGLDSESERAPPTQASLSSAIARW